jgi:NitT/TauT family transport system permease protein
MTDAVIARPVSFAPRPRPPAATSATPPAAPAAPTLARPRVARVLQAAGSFLLSKGVVTLALLLLVWEGAARLNHTVFLPGVGQTAVGAVELIRSGTLGNYLLVSYGRIFAGWALALVVAVPLGLLVGQFRIVRQIVEPFINIFRFMPAIAFITLFLMWFGVGETPKVMLIVYAACFPILINTIAGVQAIQPTFLQVAQSQGASRLQIFFSVTCPATLPHIFTGARLALGGATVSIVAAEMLCAQNGLGYLIYTSRIYFKTEWIFVGIITLGVTGYLVDRLLRYLAAKAFKRYGVAGNS